MATIFSLFNTILPVIKKEFLATLAQLQWVMNTLGIFLCSTLVVMGRIADNYGRKRLFVIAAIVSVLAFCGIGLAPDIHVIIACQALTGLGAAVFLLSSQSIMLQYYAGDETSKGMAIWAGVVAIGLALGPLIGGAFSLFLGWRWLFFILAILMLVGMALTIAKTADPKRSDQKEALDGWGALLLGITIAAFVVDIVEMNYLPHWLLITVGVIFVLALTGLIFHEKRTKNPIILFHLFKNGPFLKGSFANGLTIFYVWGAFFVLPYYLQTVLHVSEFYAGLYMLFVSIPLAAMSFVIGKLFLRFGAKKMLAIGFSFMLIAALIQTQMTPSLPIAVFLVSCLFFGFGWGFTWSVSMTAAMSDLPEDNAATASGTFLTFQEVGGSIGLACVVAVARMFPHFINGYRASMWVLVTAAAIALVISLRLGSRKKKENTYAS
jgi:EmrB/QacA subfamily drug resistance transporter